MANYNTPVVHDDELFLMTVQDFREESEHLFLSDYDGFGHPVKDDMEDHSIYVYPSELDKIPEGATHISWYNK